MKTIGSIVLAFFALVVGLAFLVLISVWTAYNGLNRGLQASNARWADVEGAYQRRYDLIPNLVETVKGVANFEKETLTGVVTARASVGQIKMTSAPGSEADIQKFAAAQQGLGTALSRLLVVSENYPQLKATDSFRDLQAQIEGTENRINVARRDYNKAVEDYNYLRETITGSLARSFKPFDPKPYFKVQDEAATAAPKVTFITPTK